MRGGGGAGEQETVSQPVAPPRPPHDGRLLRGHEERHEGPRLPCVEGWGRGRHLTQT